MYIYIFVTKAIATFWSGVVTDIRALEHFEPKFHIDFKTISRLKPLNCLIFSSKYSGAECSKKIRQEQF